MNKVELERELKELLRQRRFVAELDLDSELALQAINTNVFRTEPKNLGTVAKLFPATLVVHLAGIGQREGDGGELWPYVPYGAKDGNGQRALGRSFEAAIEELELEPFRLSEGKRYLNSILLHGLFARRSIPKLVELCLVEMKRGAADPAEMVRSWRASGRYGELLRPAQNLIDQEPAVALSYIGRLRDFLMRRAADPEARARAFGLPAFVDEELAELGAERFAVSKLSATPPILRFDPYGFSGPRIEIPSTIAPTSWFLVRDGMDYLLPGSPFEATQHAAMPATQMSIEVRSLEGRAAFLIESAHPTRPVFFFDPERTELLPPHQALTSNMIYAVWPTDHELKLNSPDGTAPDVELLPDLAGDWSGFRAAELWLDDVTSLWLDNERVATAEVGDAIELFGAPLSNMTEATGRPVYDSVPLLKLPSIDFLPKGSRISVRHRGQTWESDASSIVGEDGLLPVDSLVPDGEVLFGQVEISLIGTLGRDFQRSVIVVDGFDLSSVTDVVAPNAKIELDFHPPAGVLVLDQLELPVEQLTFSSGESHRLLRLVRRSTGQELDCVATVPRLRWSIVDEGDTPAFGVEVIRLDPFDFDSVGSRLDVETGLPATPRIELRSGERPVQLHPLAKATHRHRGRGSFNLGCFHDTLRSTEGDLDLILSVNGLDAQLAAFTKQVKLNGVKANHDDGNRGRGVKVTCQFDGTPRSWEVRVWSADRLGAPLSTHAIDARNAENIRLSLPAAPAPWLFEVIETAEPHRFPDHAAQNVALLHDGELPAEELLATAPRPPRVLVIDAESPLYDLLDGRTKAHEFPWHQVSGVLPEAFDSVLGLLNPVPGSGLVKKRPDLFELLFRSTDHFAQLVSERTATQALSRWERLAFAIDALPSAVDCPVDTENAQLRADLWGANLILAAALDRPAGGVTEFEERWRSRTGWEQGWQKGAFRPPDPRIVDLPQAKLSDLLRQQRETAPLIFESRARLIGQLEWLSSEDSEAATREWLVAVGNQLANTHSERRPIDPFITAMRSQHGVQWLNYPMRVLEAAAALIFPGSDEAFARLALKRAAEISPHLAEWALLAAIATFHEFNTGVLTEQKKEAP